MTKIKAKKIVVPFMEGLSSWKFPVEFDSDGIDCWTKFQNFVKARANELIALNEKENKKWLGYCKVDAIVYFEDGETYKARYDLTEDGLEDGKTLREHIKYFCRYYKIKFDLKKYNI